jgi:hypothetical protein
MGLSNVKIIKGNGGLGRRNPSTDGVTGVLTTGMAVAGKLTLGTTNKLNGLDDAEALGINAAYDTTNSVLVYAVLAELFRVNPDATVYLLVTPQTTAMADLVDPAKTFGPQILTDSGNSIVQLAVCFNPASAYEETLLTGLDSNVLAAVAKAQLLAEYADSIDSPLSAIGIEGLHFNGTIALAKDLRTLAGNKVSVIIGQDASSAAATAKPNHAAIGAWAGAVSLANVHENIGWPEKFPLTDAKNGKWLKAGLSGGTALTSYTPAQLDLLDDKGYIFARSIAQLAGLYFNDSHTCTALSDDYCRIERNRTMDKAIKVVRGALAPKLNSPLLVDEETGFLKPVVVADFETLAQSQLDIMQRSAEISGGTVYVNPEQNVLSSDIIEVDIEIVPLGLAHSIRVKIGFNNPFKTV